MNIKEQIAEKIDYFANEFVVPISGVPRTPYEFNAIKKYKAELGLFADQILSLIEQAVLVMLKENFRKVLNPPEVKK